MEVYAETLEDARERWFALEHRIGPPPFLGLAWQEAVRQVTPADAAPVVLSVCDRGRDLAMASVGRGVTRRARVIRSRVLWLNETGDPELDRMLVEHNGLLGDAALEGGALQAMLAHCITRAGRWDEFSLGWIDAHHWSALAPAIESLPLRPVVRQRVPYYYVDLDGLDGLDDYLARLSSNTRQQVRRALRAYGGAEALRYTVADGVDQTMAWFDELVARHQAEWQRRGRPGAFASRRVRAFHHAFLPAAAATGQAEIARIEADGELVGFLYNLSDGQTVFNYQSGLVYDADSKRKPGIVAHALAVADAIRRGRGRYDLLMGASQYKRSLSTDGGEMVWVMLQRPRLRFLLERVLRRLRDGR
ncbi:GNAT family N-acetyltransferase [Aquisalimonas asiatica]|uniref:Acetyltransferase involved in cellulose biosynthesis, CelD/BcsL family n=1 Tax=Aquisalimonas asiatica TaxID=406100 RepID=A0A1H8U602_9GAMM|nr:GNAT family N-acetyltransferase [Aquisalimonas asiatica]SEO98263.1 Acetyltransferase involved in cellulose biosynthesis, CelD/BcsL family [Aquisalimonas asiatica]